MQYNNNVVTGLKIAYIGGGSRGWAWGLMSDLASCDDINGDVYLYDAVGRFFILRPGGRSRSAGAGAGRCRRCWL